MPGLSGSGRLLKQSFVTPFDAAWSVYASAYIYGSDYKLIDQNVLRHLNKYSTTILNQFLCCCMNVPMNEQSKTYKADG